VKSAVGRFESFFDIREQIGQKMAEIFGGTWSVVVGEVYKFSDSVCYDERFYLTVQMAKLSITVCK
jgi:hypothetical protein